MTSSIDPTKPPQGVALTADVRANFLAAKTEIEALQAGKQVADPLLTALAALTTVADRMLYFTGPDAVALVPATAEGRKLLGTASNAVRIPHTWAISGEIKIASGDTDFIVPFFVPVPTGRYVRAVAARSRINGGTSATVKLQKNGVDQVTGLSVSTTSTTHNFTDFDLADGDRLALVVTAVSGVPKNLTFSLYLEYGVL